MDIKFEKDGDQPDKTRVVKNGEIVGFYLQQGISWQLCDLSSNFLLLRPAGVGGISDGDFRKLIIKAGWKTMTITKRLEAMLNSENRGFSY